MHKLDAVGFGCGQDLRIGRYYGVIRLPGDDDAYLTTSAQDDSAGAAEARARHLFDRIRSIVKEERANGPVGVRLGDKVPNFSAYSTIGPIDFYDWSGGAWVVLFSHAKDYTQLCTAEMEFVEELLPEFQTRGVKIIGLSVDPTTVHEQWLASIERERGVRIGFPIIGDSERAVADLYGLIHPNASDSSTVRGVFLIDPSKVLRMHLLYPADVGRDFREILRVVDALRGQGPRSVSFVPDAVSGAVQAGQQAAQG